MMKWLLQNVRHRAAFALKNPRYTTHAILRELVQADEKFLGHVTGVSAKHIRKYLSEPTSTPAFVTHLFSDDALWNDAFLDFARKFSEPDARIIRGVGFLRKTAE
jgi:hypothetical protein